MVNKSKKKKKSKQPKQLSHDAQNKSRKSSDKAGKEKAEFYKPGVTTKALLVLLNFMFVQANKIKEK